MFCKIYIYILLRKHKMLGEDARDSCAGMYIG